MTLLIYMYLYIEWQFEIINSQFKYIKFNNIIISTHLNFISLDIDETKLCCSFSLFLLVNFLESLALKIINYYMHL
jgi:hypothetical protein